MKAEKISAEIIARAQLEEAIEHERKSLEGAPDNINILAALEAAEQREVAFKKWKNAKSATLE